MSILRNGHVAVSNLRVKSPVTVCLCVCAIVCVSLCVCVTVCVSLCACAHVDGMAVRVLVHF